MLILFMPILFVIAAAALSRLTGKKPEQSLFVITLSMIVICLLGGFAGILRAGLYLCYAILSALIVYFIITVIKDRRNSKALPIGDYLTPGITVYLLSSILYAAASWGSVLSCTDDAVHWAQATLYMLRTGQLFKGVQTLGVPMLNYFITSITGYQEHILFAGRWMFIWAAFCLPMHNIRWDKWYKALIYAFMAYMICGVITTTPRVYMDLPLGVIAGGICAFWAIGDDRSYFGYLTLFLGIIITCQIKNMVGSIMALFIILFVIVIEAIAAFREKKLPNKKTLIFIISTIMMLPAGMLIAYFSRGQSASFKNLLSSDTSATSMTLFPVLASKINIILFAAVVVLVIALMGMLFYMSSRPTSKRHKAMLITTIIVITMVLLVFLANVARALLGSLSEDNQKFLFKYFNQFWQKGFWGKPLKC